LDLDKANFAPSLVKKRGIGCTIVSFFTKLGAELAMYKTSILGYLGYQFSQSSYTIIYSNIINEDNDQKGEIMNIRTLSLVGLVCTALTVPMAANAFKAYAKVIRVERDTQRVYVSHPERHCWDEDVVVRRGGGDSVTAPLVGGLIGGVIGNQFGSGGGKTAMTVGGALVGASVGADAARRDDREYVRTRQRCETVDAGYWQNKPTGYRVTYVYDGETYVTHTNFDPGDRIRVNVNSHVSPDE
jgi:uncharacterized protein YcfJ